MQTKPPKKLAGDERQISDAIETWTISEIASGQTEAEEAAVETFKEAVVEEEVESSTEEDEILIEDHVDHHHLEGTVGSIPQPRSIHMHLTEMGVAILPHVTEGHHLHHDVDHQRLPLPGLKLALDHDPLSVEEFPPRAHALQCAAIHRESQRAGRDLLPEGDTRRTDGV